MAVAVLASSHNIKSLDPIDKVTILTLKRYPKAREILEQGWKTQKYTPFDPVSKRITTECTCDGHSYIAAKGAPKAILNLSECTQETSDLFKNKAAEFARRGFRSLGVAVKKDNEPWELLGMLSMFDPPREDTAQTIAEAQFLGLQVKMLTGDAIAIAKETCKMLALGTKVYNSDRLIHGGLSGTTQHDLVERADGFAEVFPEHKYQVVEMIQQRGHLTAMTGDGVNDAPSLKKSDCGIAVEGASEAAQAAADIVFLAPGLSTIVSAIKIARQIFQRMKAYIQYRIALCFHLEIYLVTSMVIINETIGVELIVFLALFADLATIAVAYDNAHFEARPVEWQLPKIWVISVTMGCLLALGTWVIRGSMFLPNGGIVENFANVQEVLFLEVSLTENWLIFVTRGGQTWPAWQLVAAIFGVDVLSTLFCVFGWLSGEGYATDPRDRANLNPNGRTSVVTAVVIWAYSIGVTVSPNQLFIVCPFTDLLCFPRLSSPSSTTWWTRSNGSTTLAARAVAAAIPRWKTSSVISARSPSSMSATIRVAAAGIWARELRRPRWTNRRGASHRGIRHACCSARSLRSIGRGGWWSFLFLPKILFLSIQWMHLRYIKGIATKDCLTGIKEIFECHTQSLVASLSQA